MITDYSMFVQTEVPEDEVIISRTDLNGKITYANDLFAEISGYKTDELIGKSHAIIRHPDMPISVFKNLWETIKKEETWSGYVKNLRSDGGYYWVFATISGVYKDGELVEYKSIRTPVTKHMQEVMQQKYDTLRKKEENEVRVICYLKSDLVDKIENSSKNSSIDSCKFLNEIIESSELLK